MDIIIDNIGVLLISIIVMLITWSMRRPPGMPPGPIRLPVIGNVLSIDKDIRKTFKKMRKRYGDIFSVYMFHQPIIVLNGYDVINDALVKNADLFKDRPSSFLADQVAMGKGVILTSGDVWQEHRRFSMGRMRDFGMGKFVLEKNIGEEISYLLEGLEGNVGKPFNCRYIVQCAVANIICTMTFGKRYLYSDPLFQKLVHSTDALIHVGTASVVNVLPFVRYFPGDMFDFWKLIKERDVLLNECVNPMIEEHKKDYNESDISDFISAYIKEMKNSEEQGKHTTLDIENLRITVLQLFVAGMETTATTLRWALLNFLHHPEVQEKCFQEIEGAIGLERSPSMKDKLSLPYMEATIAEVQRCSDILPTSLAHSVPHTLQYKGYTFEKGCTIIPMISSVLDDEHTWGDPQNFRPDRFLDDNGKFIKNENLIVFSIGKRACLGEALARMELFLMLTALIQRFKFVPSGEVIPPLTSLPGTIYTPLQFELQAIPRKI